MARLIALLCCVTPLALAGCATKANARPTASIWRVRDEAAAEVSDTVHDVGHSMARTWSDIWHDWNYADDETFGDIRNAAGQ